MSTILTTSDMTSAPPQHRPARSRHARHHSLGFWLVTYVFAVTMAFAGAPAPLYVLYQQRNGFGSFTITVIFAAYAAGVVVSLFLAGHISDRFGRRPIIATAVLLNVLAALIFLTSMAVPGLLLARFASGLGVGMLTATATAHLTELHAQCRPHSGPRRAEVVSTAANIGGIGLGPLITGLLAEYVDAPLYTPYLVFAFLLLAGVMLVVIVPETVRGVDSTWTYRPQRVVVPRSALGQYVAATMTAFVGFAMFGFFTSLAPSFLAGQLGITSHAVAGAVAFVVFVSSAACQVVSARWPRSVQFATGLALLGAGLAVVVAAITLSSLIGLLIGGIIAGAGVGVGFKAAVGIVIGIAPAESRGEALAGLFLIGYIGMALPVLLLGLMLQQISLVTAVTAFGAAMLALLIITAVVLRRSVR